MKLVLSIFLFFASLGAEPKICLSLKFDDDCRELARCLTSVKGIADCISVCDTGIAKEADAGFAVLKDFLEREKLPHRIEELDSFTDFDAVRVALRAIEQAGFSPDDTYILLFSPNDVLKVGSAFSKSSLEDDSYLLLAKASAHYHYDLSLIRAGAAASFQSFFSDLASYRAPPFSTKLRSLMIEKGGRQSIEPLLEAVKKNPKDGKALFALAQAHRQSEVFQEAIRWYTARIETGERGEEIWFSKYKIGECHEALGDWDAAFRWYLDAYQTDPKRPESLLKIATHYREAGMNDIAYLFAKYGSETPFPKMRNLYPFLCNYQFDEELSIAAYYTRFKEEGYRAASNLVLKKNVPGYVRDQTYRNLLFYVAKLKNVRYVNLDFDIPFIEGTKEKYHPMNPSVVKTKEGYKVHCRVVSYTQEGAKHFHTADPNGIFRNRNFLLTYDKDFRLLSEAEIIEDLPRERIPHFLLEGMEDLRLFEIGRSLWFTATCFDTNPTGNLQISLAKLSDKPDGKIVKVEKLIPLLGPDPYRCEKNWLPFLKDGAIHAIYSYDPFIVYLPDPHTGACQPAVHYKPPHDFARFRGSAAPIPFDGGYLLMIHEVVFMPDFTRCYLHRFLFMDPSFQIRSLSKPFLFDHAGVEFCCGITATHSGEGLVMAIGLEDREAKLGIIGFETVRSLLEPLPPTIEYPYEE